jgi:hypothetical protein
MVAQPPISFQFFDISLYQFANIAWPLEFQSLAKSQVMDAWFGFDDLQVMLRDRVERVHGNLFTPVEKKAARFGTGGVTEDGPQFAQPFAAMPLRVSPSQTGDLACGR